MLTIGTRTGFRGVPGVPRREEKLALASVGQTPTIDPRLLGLVSVPRSGGLSGWTSGVEIPVT
jgi:hypothetical protein